MRCSVAVGVELWLLQYTTSNGIGASSPSSENSSDSDGVRIMAQSGTLDAVSTPATSMVILILGPHPPSSALQVAEVEGGAARPGVARRPTSVAASSVRIESDGTVAEGRERSNADAH